MDSPTRESTIFVHDVVIIGSGPCGLAVASRLCEHTPSAIFTDEEHQRYHWIRKHGARMSIKNKKSGQIAQAAPRLGRRYSTLVLDATGDQWMNRWNKLFKTFEIKNLRSPMFWHVDPSDRDGLLAYTHEQRRENELVEIRECVGKEISKHLRKKRTKTRKAHSEVEIDERDRKDYFTPSLPLFSEHCECIVDRYGLRDGLIQQEQVQDIEYGCVGDVSDVDKIFTVRTNKGVHHARTVVLAVGPANAPNIPDTDPMQGSRQMCHTMQIQQFPDPVVSAKIKAKKETNVMVVGGGLTSAQISDLAIRKGVTKVWHLMRGPCKVKPFDVDLAWMGKYRNLEQAKFWTADTDEERLEQIKSARGGGSLNPPFHKILKQQIARGSVSLHTHTVLESKSYDASTQTWMVKTEPRIPELPPIDYIYFATGIQTDFATLPCLKSMNRDYPIHGHGGLPCLNEDLMWKDGVPLFVTGRLAGLRLGPAAGNLGGARVGAERIAWSIEDVLAKTPEHADEIDEEFDYVTARGNRYTSLSVADIDE
ncbi:putative fad binding domain-containing protein [Diplodia seriata]|uniref:L-ornithine N(5)-monooxygenase [NAD(P)H] n=1 Tax=Diplodia seriata TaxID=420778 RepID=A0A0G2DWW4_9PEZI|nr:putative fad binding domain-containing protein [Diplodia seriata]